VCSFGKMQRLIEASLSSLIELSNKLKYHAEPNKNRLEFANYSIQCASVYEIRPRVSLICKFVMSKEHDQEAAIIL
jgi:hypothetical protein